VLVAVAGIRVRDWLQRVSSASSGAFYTTKPGGLGMGPLDLPFDHRSSWGTIVGGPANVPQGAVFQFTVGLRTQTVQVDLWRPPRG